MYSSAPVPDYGHSYDHSYGAPQSTHGIKLNITGGHAPTSPYADPELAAAAINPHEVVIQVDGKSIFAPIDEIDPNKVELACDDTGCALIPDDGNPYNDIHPVGGKSSHEPSYSAPKSTHGIDLPLVGGNSYVPYGTDPEIAAAAVNPHEAVIVHGGKAFLAPIDEIDPDKVELACNDDGCALIQDDGNPYNDIVPLGPGGY